VYKLVATILKDSRLLLRDKVGLLFMFAMPVVLVMIVTSIQNSTFELASRNKVPLLLYNLDTGSASRQFIKAIDTMGLFRIMETTDTGVSIQTRVRRKDALLGILIPADFSARIQTQANNVTGKVLKSFGLDSGPETPHGASPEKRAGTQRGDDSLPITLYYQPILQASFRQSAAGAIYSALQLVQSRQILRKLYFAINEKDLPDSLEKELLSSRTTIAEVPVSHQGVRGIPNASEHNVPAWTIFAMYFVVISLGSGIVREKRSGSFMRLNTLPTSYFVAILSKQLTYLAVTLVQAAVIFAIGAWLFPLMGLPPLHFPGDWSALILVSLLCGWSAVSYAICIGVFAQTEEQANGIGAVSIVILAAIGGLMVPGFAMPASFRTAMSISPLHWCLEAYYSLFLEGGRLKDVGDNVVSLLLIIAALQGLSFWGLKRKNLI
jgi:ABC-2 type transport system permease protein